MLNIVDIYGEIEGDYEIIATLPRNATNGDVVKAMFPDLVNSDLDLVEAFNRAREWWNAPFKKEVEE